jgi:hypothetical protein
MSSVRRIVPKSRNIYSQRWNWGALFLISTFMYLGAIYIFPQSVLFGTSIFLHCGWAESSHKWTTYTFLLNCRSKEKGRELPPNSALRSRDWVNSYIHKWSTIKFPIWKNTEHKWKQLILVVNILFGLRVNEIPNKTFILDSHQLFICSVYLRRVESLLSFR